jgi:hypothetical protein
MMVLRRRKRNLKSVGAEADRGPLYVPLRDLPKAALTVKLVTPNLKTQVPRALDIGYFGMLIEFDSSKFSDLAFGSPVELRLRLGVIAVKLVAEVRRSQGRRYRLAFPESLEEGNVTAPPALRRIVDALEAQWLQSRSTTAPV